MEKAPDIKKKCIKTFTQELTRTFYSVSSAKESKYQWRMEKNSEKHQNNQLHFEKHPATLSTP